MTFTPLVIVGPATVMGIALAGIGCHNICEEPLLALLEDSSPNQ